MTTFISDTFTDVDGTLLTAHTPGTGGAWSGIAHRMINATATTQAAECRTGVCRSTASGALTQGFRNAAVPPSRQQVIEFSLIVNAGNMTVNTDAFAVAGRMTSSGTTFATVDRYTCAWTRIAGVNTWELAKVVAGTKTTLATFAETLTPGTYSVRFECLDAAKKIIVNGVEKCSSTDNTITQVGRVGIALPTNTAGSIDNLVASEPVAPPSTPANLTAVATGASTIDVAWDAVAGLPVYDLERDGVVIATDLVDTTYTDSGLTASTAYSYRVRAGNSGGDSAWSSAVVATTSALSPVIDNPYKLNNYEVTLIAPPTASDYGQPREFLTAQVDSIVWELNQPGLCTFTMDSQDSRVESVQLMETEILVTRNGRKIFRGIPVRAQANDQTVQFQCPGLLYYFTKRFVGDANRRNYLTNGSFEDGSVGGIPIGWNEGPDPIETLTVSNTKSAQDGDNLLRMTESRVVTTWAQSDGSGTATVEDVTARLVARSNITRSGTAGSIDGVNLVTGDRVLLTNQNDKAFNGIWIVDGGAWVRATNFNTDAEIRGKRVKVTEGDRWAGTGWRNTNSTAITVDTHSIYFSQYAYTKITPRETRLHQTITPTPGVRYTFKGWFYIDDWDGPSWKDRAIALRCFRSDNDKTLGFAAFKVDKDTPRNRWIRAECSLKVPSDANPTEVRLRPMLFGIRGVIKWDHLRLVRRETLLDGETDRVAAAKALVEHAQDPAYDKTELNIGTAGANQGNLTNRRYPHDEHENIFDALQALSEGSEGVDFYVDEDTRTFTVDQERGTLKERYALEVGRNIGGFEYLVDGDRTANSIVVLAPGEGPDREEAFARTLGGFSGMAWEDVIPLNSHYKELQKKAKHAVTRRNRLVEHITVTTVPGSDNLIDNLTVGDRVPLRVHRGFVDFDKTVRVWGIELRPSDEVMTLRFNAA